MAKNNNVSVNCGLVVSSDIFYDTTENLHNYAKNGAVAVEMEIAGLYALAKKFGKNAMAVLNITDKPLKGEGLTADERVTLMYKLIRLTLDTAINLKG